MGVCRIGRQHRLLPEMENPASENEIEQGYQAIGADGDVMTGTMKPAPTMSIKASSSTSAIQVRSNNYNPTTRKVTVSIYSTTYANGTITIQLN